MDDLIKALIIFRKYGNPEFPTNCEHDHLYVNIDPVLVSDEDLDLLKELHFAPSDCGGFESTFFGSC